MRLKTRRPTLYSLVFACGCTWVRLFKCPSKGWVHGREDYKLLIWILILKSAPFLISPLALTSLCNHFLRLNFQMFIEPLAVEPEASSRLGWSYMGTWGIAKQSLTRKARGPFTHPEAGRNAEQRAWLSERQEDVFPSPKEANIDENVSWLQMSWCF